MIVAAAGLFGFAAPALAAADPQLVDISLSASTISAGNEVTVNFTVKMSDGSVGIVDPVSVTSSNNKVTCSSTCSYGNVPIPPEGIKYQVKFKATGSFQQDEQSTMTIRAGKATNNQQLAITAPKQTAPPASANVPEVSGTVVDATNNKPIGAAMVSIQDSAATTWSAGTDTSGKFKITSTQDKPIKPGTIAFTVEKDGLQPFPGMAKQAMANQPLTGVRLAVTLAPTTPTASPAAGGPTADPNTTGAGISPLETAGNVTPTSGSGGGLSWVLIAVGAILVALGVGAIVLLFVRKKDEGNPDGQDPNMPRRGGPPGQQGPPGRGGPRPPQRRGPGEMGPPMRSGPGPDPTRQMRPPVSPGPRGDQTMISPSPLANAPTQLHGRIPDQTDPYGAPPPRNGGQPGYGQDPYGAAGGGAHGGSPPSVYPSGSPTYGQGPDQYGQQGYGQGPGTDPYGPQHTGYGQDGYNPAHGGGYEPRGQRPGPAQPPAQPDPRRVDWLDD